MAASISREEYLKKYISGDVKKKKKKRKIPQTSSTIKRSQIIDDDIDLKSMRPLNDDEVDLYEMDEDAPQIAGIIDERPAELKAQEQYNPKRWKVFGGENGVNVQDNMDTKKQSLKAELSEADEKTEKTNKSKSKAKLKNLDSDSSPARQDKKHVQIKKQIRNKTKLEKSDSDTSLPRKNTASRYSDSDASPPRRDLRRENLREEIKPLHKRNECNSDCSPPRVSSEKFIKQNRGDSSTRKYKHQINYKGPQSDSDNSPPRVRDNRKPIKGHRTKDKSREVSYSDSDESPPRREKSFLKSSKDHRTERKSRKRSSSDSDKSTGRSRQSIKRDYKASRKSRSKSPSQIKYKAFHHKTDRSGTNSPNTFREDSQKKKFKKEPSDSDNSPPRKNKLSRHVRSSSDLSPPRIPTKDCQPRKKVLYKPQDGFSSDEESRSRNRKMKVTLDGKRAGLQDAKELKQELSNLKKREDEVFSKLDASMSGIGAAAVKRDRKTGQIRDLEKEKEAQKEKEAKATVVNEKYSKWGKGLKQVEDAATRAAEAIREMNKPLARYADDKDLDDFLKAQEREGDPMLDFIKQKQREATPLVGEKPIYKGPYNPNRFGIRPGHRWDGVVRSNGYEKEWFTHQNARKAVSEEAYKWSTSDM